MRYLSTIHKATSPKLVALKQYALKHDVPIILDETSRFLSQMIRLKNVSSVLEIGTAIAYNALNLAIEFPSLKITTIERNPDMILEAKQNIKSIAPSSHITLIEQDALEVDLNALNSFDLIFIDAAKAQHIKFFEKYETLLNDNGIIIIDNVLFHDVNLDNVKSRNLKQLIKKVDRFNHYIMERSDYHSVIHPIGDGVCLSIKR